MGHRGTGFARPQGPSPRAAGGKRRQARRGLLVSLPFGQRVELELPALVPEPSVDVVDTAHEHWRGVGRGFLDGALDQDFEHIAGLGQLGALSWTYEPLIIVGVQTKDRRAELTRRPQDARYAAEFPQAGGARRFQDFIATELIPFIDARYRTGEGRALMGESLAGLFVVDTFLHRPELFRDYIAISPSLWWDDQHFARDGGHDLEGCAASNRRLYLAIANEGGATQAGMNRFLGLLEAAPQGSVTWRYSDRSATETHATIYPALDALRWLYAMPEQNYGPTPWYYLENGSPPPSH